MLLAGSVLIFALLGTYALSFGEAGVFLATRSPDLGETSGANQTSAPLPISPGQAARAIALTLILRAQLVVGSSFLAVQELARDPNRLGVVSTVLTAAFLAVEVGGKWVALYYPQRAVRAIHGLRRGLAQLRPG
ncbi:MAG: hypothetical protein AAF560_00065 [Acidobacteriota bacterium]